MSGQPSGCSSSASQPLAKMSWVTWVLMLAVLLAVGQADPVPRPAGVLPLAAASELSARLAAHAQHVPALPDPRLPIPTPQDIEVIKKVAQILITLGQQVIPSIIGDPSAPTLMASCDPEDAVGEDSS
ncbi:uncharacterized protein LOC128677266 [Plodia interpunctella]|uniref:uncharacterized protein LOC128677266 n=1 Tax=Plodia interpunctella TaxID=58824 RepID=UPI0023682F24|nr:uncharacterized protein LOC128677266 [Plodia interpunctella]